MYLSPYLALNAIYKRFDMEVISCVGCSTFAWYRWRDTLNQGRSYI